MKFKIPVYQPEFFGNEKKYVLECLESGWISSKGTFVQDFETRFANYIGINNAATVANGTVALHLALLALGIKEGDEVIVPSLTYIASVNAIKYVGAVPVFVDSLPDSLQMDCAAIIRKITAKTKAIIAVHLYGLSCEMSSLLAITREHRLFLIEDCAEALGSFYKGQHVGTFGDIATFSFYGNKTITTGEGGMVVTNDNQLHEAVLHFKGQGLAKNREYWHDVIGYNYRMTNICAAIGLAQLENIDNILKKKRLIAQWYKNQLNGLPVMFHEEPSFYVHSYWMVSILVLSCELRDRLRRFLANALIETRPFFAPAHLMPMYQEYGACCPIAEDVSGRGINLPSWPGLTGEQVKYIVEQIHIFFQNELVVAHEQKKNSSLWSWGACKSCH